MFSATFFSEPIVRVCVCVSVELGRKEEKEFIVLLL
jgi:hypothetical protein